MMIKMSVVDWISVPDNPRQRDTARRAEWAKKKHLSQHSKIHDLVLAATIRGEVRWKLDGHTRAWLWERAELELPHDGNVDVYCIDVANAREAKEVYDQLDSKSAYKQTSDIIFGLCREQKIKLKSVLLRRCKFFTQLKLAETGTFQEHNKSVLLRKWKSQLLDLDSLDLSKRFPQLISAALLSIRRDGLEVAGPFWKSVDRDEGTKTEAGADAIEALHLHMLRRKDAGTTAGYTNVADILSRAWFAYEAFLDGKRLRRGLGQVRISDIIEHLNECESKTNN